MLWNPFKRARYTFRTILAPDDCRKRILDGMNDYNAAARARFLLATAIGERFTARMEPGSFGPRGSGTFMKYFVVEAAGAFPHAWDGTVEVTIAFKWSVSLFQIVWRLLLVCFLLLVAWMILYSPIVFIAPLGIAAFFGLIVLPWSIIAYVQGMRQASKDWATLVAFMRTSLASHAVDRA